MSKREIGRFVWFELVSDAAAKARAFYSELFGWKVEEIEMGGGMRYPMIKLAGDKGIGGFAPLPKPGLSPHWLSYVSVEDVDASARTVVEKGGKKLMDGFDVPGVGRMTPVADPQGAPFVLFRASEGDAPAAEGIGAFHWNELWSPDPAAALRFYAETLGYAHSEMAMPEGAYYVLERGGAPRGGIMKAPAGAPTGWTQYVTVDDVEAAIARAKRAGGAALGEAHEVEGVGRFAHLRDPLGALVGVIKPAAR